jgi:hypothetical protein
MTLAVAVAERRNGAPGGAERTDARAQGRTSRAPPSAGGASSGALQKAHRRASPAGRPVR